MKAVIPAAGKGTRFHPWTLQNAKELIPVIDPVTKNIVAVIDLVVREAQEAGCGDILLITALGKSGIKDHLTRQQLTGNISRDIRLHYTDQHGAKGLGDAIKYGKSFIGQEDFIVLLGDDFHSFNPTKELVEIYEAKKFDGKFGAILTVQKLPQELLKRYGVVKVHNDGNMMIAEDIIEKPSTPPSEFAVTGRYILSNKIFSYINTINPDTKGEVQLTDAIRAMIKDGYKVYCVELKGKRYDAGDPVGWIQTIIDLKNHKKI